METHKWFEYKESPCGIHMSNEKCVADCDLNADNKTRAKNERGVLNTTMC